MSMSIRKERISNESSTMNIEEFYSFTDHHASEQIYSYNYSLLTLRRQVRNNRKDNQLPTISLDTQSVHKNNMKDLLIDLKREKKILKIHKKVRNRYNYMHYPFYKHKININNSATPNLQFL